MSEGRLIGIGVGPGDPKLLTLRAVEAIRAVDLVACLAAEGKESMALRIASEHLGSARVREFSAPMRASGKSVSAFYDDTARELAHEMERGADVGFLCLGDPLFYGSFCYLLDRLRDRFVCKVVPGITSVAAASARALTPLATQREGLSILPAGGDDMLLVQALERGDCVIVMKLGEYLSKVRRVLNHLEKSDQAWLAAEVGWPNEQVVRLADWPHDEAPYMAVLIVTASDSVP